MTSLARALIVFAFMALLTVHFGTGLLSGFTEKPPRAVEGIDTVLELGLASWLGRANTLALLAFLTLLLPVLVYRHNLRLDGQPETQAATVRPARMQRVVDRAPKTEIRPEDRQMLANFLDTVVDQVVNERNMMKENENPRPFVRLVPQVPIRPEARRSWFGGRPSLPEGTAWPTCGGKPAAFLAQIDCSALPADLWDGVGPRTGWLCAFLGYEDGYIAARVLHTPTLGTPAEPPLPADFEWLSLHETQGSDWTSLVRKDVQQWPVDVVPVSSKRDDPLVRRPLADRNEDNPRFIRYRTGFSLDDARWKPFDWPTTLLMLDMAVAHARETVGRHRRWGDDAERALAQISASPERYGDPDKARADAETRSAHAAASAAGWQAHLPEIEAMRAAASDEAGSAPFSEARLDRLIAALAAITVPGRNGAPPAQAFPTVAPPDTSGNWLTNWARLAHDHARHAYAADPRALPPAWRAVFEEQSTYDALREMGTMRHVPDGYVHDFSMASEVTLLQLRTSHLMNWIWGDTYDLVLTIRKADLARGDFSRIKAQITN